MLSIYNAILPVLRIAVGCIAPFNAKIRRGLVGRRLIAGEIREHYTRPIVGTRVLIHVASLGELEQAKPVIAAIKERWPGVHIHLTFFSPSGYDNAIGKYRDADIITYLPIDTPGDVREFLSILNPDIALFTKYDVWPNMAIELERRGVPAILFSATANEGSGRWMPLVRALNRRVYRTMRRILVIDEADRTRFAELGVEPSRLIVTGDTRFDQVLSRKAALELRNDSSLPASLVSRLEEKGTFVFVVGSAWENDEKLIEHTIKESIKRSDNLLTIVIPHEPSEHHLRQFERAYGVDCIRFSKLADYRREPLILVDSIGRLFGLYRYADAALIGGGFSAGVHNVLEAAVWSVPTIVGPKHPNSPEISKLVERLGCFEVRTREEFEFAFWQIVKNDDLRTRAGEASREFVEVNRGATERIIGEIAQVLRSRALVN